MRTESTRMRPRAHRSFAPERMRISNFGRWSSVNLEVLGLKYYLINFLA
jgi:hypothetical protein